MINDTPLLHGVPKLVVYARTSFQQGDLARAAQLYEQACQVNPDDYQARACLLQFTNRWAVMRKLMPLGVEPSSWLKSTSNFTPTMHERFTLGQASYANWDSERGVSNGPSARWRRTRKKPPSFITWAVSTLSRVNRKKQSIASKRRRHAGTGIRAGRKKTPTWILYAPILASRRCSNSAQERSLTSCHVARLGPKGSPQAHPLVDTPCGYGHAGVHVAGAARKLDDLDSGHSCFRAESDETSSSRSGRSTDPNGALQKVLTAARELNTLAYL
jgi:hypothetical protein